MEMFYLISATKSRGSNIQGFKKRFTNNNGFKIINSNITIVVYLLIKRAELYSG